MIQAEKPALRVPILRNSPVRAPNPECPKRKLVPLERVNRPCLEDLRRVSQTPSLYHPTHAERQTDVQHALAAAVFIESAGAGTQKVFQ